MSLRIKTWIEQNKYSRLHPCISDADIEKAEKKLGLHLPMELKELLLATNGDGDIFLSLNEIIDINGNIHSDRTPEMPSNMLLFAHNGCGDYFGYLISQESQDRSIYLWDHDVNSIYSVASTLEEFIERLIREEI